MLDMEIITEEFKMINGVNLYFKTIGKGIPIIVVHGGPGLAHNYLFTYFSQLCDQYQIIFYDQRACGLSTGDETEKDITMENFIEDIEGIRKAFGIDKVNLIGQSYGGLITLSYAVKYPQNMGSLLILESAAANPESDIQFELIIDKRKSQFDKTQLSKFENELEFSNAKSEIMKKYFMILFKYYFFDESFLSELSLDYLTDKMVDKLFLSGRCIKSDPNLLKLLPIIKCPTLIIHGDYDPIPVEDIRLIHNAIVQSQFIIIKDCGHFAHIEKQSQYFNEIRKFYNKYIN
ncbi:MAG: alpha/beta fold hydrolase [Spirochaetaceae bacterium]